MLNDRNSILSFDELDSFQLNSSTHDSNFIWCSFYEAENFDRSKSQTSQYTF